MPLECNTYGNDGTLTRQMPIEAGTYHSYRFDVGPIGKVVLTGCHEEDRGGRIYVFSDAEMDSLLEPDGSLNQGIENHGYEIIPPGVTVPVAIPENGMTLFFTHNSMN